MYWTFERRVGYNMVASALPRNAVVLTHPNGYLFLDNVTTDNQGDYMCQWSLSKHKKISAYGILVIEGKIKSINLTPKHYL